MFDYHMHSTVSFDGHDSGLAMAMAAKAAGLKEICFTDHVEPITWGDNELRPLPYDWAPLKEEFARAKEAVGDRITLRLGIELGDAVHDFAHTAKILENAPEFDFVIGSIHNLSPKWGGLDFFLLEYDDPAFCRAVVEDYLD
mgnify:CR=1 FL=1